MTTLTAATPTATGVIPAVPRMGGGPAPALGAGITGADVLRVFRQRLIMILLLWSFVILATCGLTILMIKYYPIYRAEAVIQVESVDPINVLQPLEPTRTNAQEMERNVRDQALRMKSATVLLQVLQDPQIKTSSWYSEKKEEAERWGELLVDLLGEAVSAVPVRETSFIRLGANARLPNEARLLADVVAKIYLADVKEQHRSEIRESAQQLETELATARKEFDAKVVALEAFRANSSVLSNSGAMPNEKLATLRAFATELDLDRLGKQAQYETLENADPDSIPLTADLQAILNQDPTVYRLEQQVQDAEQRISLLRLQGFGPKHPTMKSAIHVYEAVQERASAERAIRLSQAKLDMIARARRNYLDATQMLTDVMENLLLAEAEQKDQDAAQARYLRLLEERDMLRMKMEQLQQYRDLVNMTLRSKVTLKVRLASKAVEPKRRHSPRWMVWLPAGTVLGLLLSCGLALLLEFTDKTVRTPRDVVRHASLPVLGTIPTSDDDEIEIKRIETASIDAPHSIVAEAFRQLRANLFFSAPAEQQGVLLVTSPSAENGKTTVSTNLAISIALSGRRVLLIDANFRRPLIPKIFPQTREDGLSNILIGQARLDDVVSATAVPGLDVVGTGPMPPNPAELLGCSYLRDLIVDARSRYDQVVFDGPPVLLVSDAVVLGGAVDGVLMICQYRSTSRGALQRARAQLDAINTRIFGVVLNRIETRAGGYFRKAYREFYEYQEPASDDDRGTPPPQLDLLRGGHRLDVSDEALGGAAISAAPPKAPVDQAHASHAVEFGPDPDSRPPPSEPHDEGDLDPTPSIEIEDLLGDIHIDESLALGEGLDDLEDPIDAESSSTPTPTPGDDLPPEVPDVNKVDDTDLSWGDIGLSPSDEFDVETFESPAEDDIEPEPQDDLDPREGERPIH